jgi:GST-like protein
MIDLYTWATPNGRRVSIMLEELELPYAVHPVDLGAGAQKSDSYLAINPTGKIPAIRDRETGELTYESGAIIWSLAERTGRLLPNDAGGRQALLKRFLWLAGGAASDIGMAYFITRRQPDNPLAPKLVDNAAHVLSMLDGFVREGDYLGGADYGVLDVMAFPWACAGLAIVNAPDQAWPHLHRWIGRIEARAAVQRGMAVPVSPTAS